MRLVFHRTSGTAVLILVIVARAVVVITPTSFTHLMECLLRRVVERDDVVEFKVPMALNPNRLDFGWVLGSPDWVGVMMVVLHMRTTVYKFRLSFSFSLTARRPPLYKKRGGGHDESQHVRTGTP